MPPRRSPRQAYRPNPSKFRGVSESAAQYDGRQGNAAQPVRPQVHVSATGEQTAPPASTCISHPPASALSSGLKFEGTTSTGDAYVAYAHSPVQLVRRAARRQVGSLNREDREFMTENRSKFKPTKVQHDVTLNRHGRCQGLCLTHTLCGCSLTAWRWQAKLQGPSAPVCNRGKVSGQVRNPGAVH